MPTSEELIQELLRQQSTLAEMLERTGFAGTPLSMQALFTCVACVLSLVLFMFSKFSAVEARLTAIHQRLSCIPTGSSFSVWPHAASGGPLTSNLPSAAGSPSPYGVPPTPMTLREKIIEEEQEPATPFWVTKESMAEIAIVVTDIQQSTPIWEWNSACMDSAQDLHDSFLVSSAALFNGVEVGTEGDSFLIAFETASEAVQWCLRVQEELLYLPWDEALLERPEAKEVFAERDHSLLFRGLRVRMGCHTGPPVNVRTNPVTGRLSIVGSLVHKSKAINGTAHGGQVVMSANFWEMACMDKLSFGGACAIDLGKHDLGEGVGKMGLLQLQPASAIGQRTFPAIRTQRKLSQSFFDAPQDVVTIAFVMYLERQITNVDPMLSSLKPFNGYACQSEAGCMMIAFHTPSDAVGWALDYLQQLGEDSWKSAVKIGITTGEPSSCRPHTTTGRADYFGLVVHLAARCAQAAAPSSIIMCQQSWLNCQSAKLLMSVPCECITEEMKQFKGITELTRIHKVMSPWGTNFQEAASSLDLKKLLAENPGVEPSGGQTEMNSTQYLKVKLPCGSPDDIPRSPPRSSLSKMPKVRALGPSQARYDHESARSPPDSKPGSANSEAGRRTPHQYSPQERPTENLCDGCAKLRGGTQTSEDKIPSLAQSSYVRSENSSYLNCSTTPPSAPTRLERYNGIPKSASWNSRYTPSAPSDELSHECTPVEPSTTPLSEAEPRCAVELKVIASVDDTEGISPSIPVPSSESGGVCVQAEHSPSDISCKVANLSASTSPMGPCSEPTVSPKSPASSDTIVRRPPSMQVSPNGPRYSPISTHPSPRPRPLTLRHLLERGSGGEDEEAAARSSGSKTCRPRVVIPSSPIPVGPPKAASARPLSRRGSLE